MALLEELKAYLTNIAELEVEEIEEAHYLDDPEVFTVDEIKEGMHEQDAIVVKFRNVASAIQVKRKSNHKFFYGKELYVQYAPNLESSEDLRAKLEQRIQKV